MCGVCREMSLNNVEEMMRGYARNEGNGLLVECRNQACASVFSGTSDVTYPQFRIRLHNAGWTQHLEGFWLCSNCKGLM